MAISGFGNNNNWNNYNKNKLNINKNVNTNKNTNSYDNLNINELGSVKSDGFVKPGNNPQLTQMGKSWGDYQADYCNKRLGEGWATNGGAIRTDGFAEQTCFLSTIYATVRWLGDKIGGLFS